ncbi:MAG: 3-deoxy-manno-octulosonate cytidylyltransferase [Shinella sp.]|nr:3-deoxy-manno-octulosonate cytidylyltransferase [Shinella sp.]
MADILQSGASNLPADYRALPDEEWKAFFGRYPHIVLVANSESVDLETLRKTLPQTSLFIFFNKVYKVLDRPFAGNALLVSRSGTMGANIVHRREAAEVLAFFPNEGFLGVLNVRAATEERFSPKPAFGNVEVRHLDLSPLMDFYPAGKIATSGFALALWLSKLGLESRVHLAGFSARRSEKWKLFPVHDWTFEQVFLRLFARSGRLTIGGGTDASSYSAFARHFPDIQPSEIALTAAEVLAERLDGANLQIDRLMSVTKVIRSLDNFFRRLKPKTRKEIFLEKSQNSPGAGEAG